MQVVGNSPTTNLFPTAHNHDLFNQPMKPSLLLASLLGSLSDLASLVNLHNALDNTDSDGLSHVTNGETAKRRIFGESLDAHGLGGNHLNNSSIARLDELGGGFNRLASSAIDLLEEFGELASNVGGVAIQDWGITSTDLTRVVENDDLSIEGLSTLWWIVLGVTSDVTTADFLYGDVLDVEADIVARKALGELFVVHLDGFDFSGHTSRGEGDDHAGLNNTSLNATDWYSADATDLVNILERKSEGLVGWTRWGIDGIDSLEESLTGRLGLGLLLPALVPWAVGRYIDHVVAVEARDWDEWNVLRIVTNLLDEVRRLLDDFVETILGPLSGVHLVDSNDELLDTKGVC